MPLSIDADFHGGNIEVRDLGDDWADLAIRADSNGPWFQWFSFRVGGAAAGRPLRLRILNAGGSSYPDGWPGYRACVSPDGLAWTRADTAYEAGVLRIAAAPPGETLHVAYFPPYDDRRHADLLQRAQGLGARHDVLGVSLDGRPIDRLRLGEGPRQVWLLGRQHSGETMASWWMEGALDRLARPGDPALAAWLAGCTVHLAPLVNVDGAARGNLRANAAGLDLNRQWHAPDPARAPEVACVLAAMDAAGVDFSLDVHGDETLPHVFLDGADVDPLAAPAQVAGVEAFRQALLAAAPAFQTRVGYPATYAGDEAPGMATRAVARRFGAVAATLEMPFKQSLELPDPLTDWSPALSRQLGAQTVEALFRALPS